MLCCKVRFLHRHRHGPLLRLQQLQDRAGDREGRQGGEDPVRYPGVLPGMRQRYHGGVDAAFGIAAAAGDSYPVRIQRGKIVTIILQGLSR